MSNQRARPYEIGERIPDLRLPALGPEDVTPLRGGARESVALVFPHRRCEACRAYVADLDRAEDSFRRWDARLTVVLPRDEEPEPWSDLAHVAVVRDERDELWPRLAEGGAGVVVADRWGAVYEAVQVGAGHALPDAHELVEWLRFIATQCPECGVPDTPGLGTWS